MMILRFEGSLRPLVESPEPTAAGYFGRSVRIVGSVACTPAIRCSRRILRTLAHEVNDENHSIGLSTPHALRDPVITSAIVSVCAPSRA
jgi:hypothetical protein